MSQRVADIAIVGGGAAGLASAIFAGEVARQRGVERHVVVLDGARKLGAKILVAGGGRCNVTHDRVTPEDYAAATGSPRNVVRNVLRQFDESAAVRWFESMGVPLKREATGKLFPVTDRAATVLEALLKRCGELGVEVKTDHRVRDIAAADDAQAPMFRITHSQGETHARQVILATGGRSLPRTGSDGAGWRIVERLGHSVTPTYPALAPLVLDAAFFHAALAGVSHEVELSTFVDGKRIDRRTGSLLWTHFGISGPVAMDASRYWIIAAAQQQPVQLRCSVLPGETFESIERLLIESAERSPRRPVTAALADRLPRRVADALAAHVAIDAAQPLGQLARDQRRTLVHALTALVLPVRQDRGWNYAEVTAGGVPLAEVDHRTMASRRVSRLYLVGEILDCDGRIGGFNFQWAWSTGHIAGRAAALHGLT